MTKRQSKGRRELFAAVALADLPMPVRISFDADHRSDVTLVFDSVAACVTWANTLNIDVDPYHSEAELKACGWGMFAGRKVCLLASEPASVESEPPVTGTTRDRLQRLTPEVA